MSENLKNPHEFTFIMLDAFSRWCNYDCFSIWFNYDDVCIHFTVFYAGNIFWKIIFHQKGISAIIFPFTQAFQSSKNKVWEMSWYSGSTELQINIAWSGKSREVWPTTSVKSGNWLSTLFLYNKHDIHVWNQQICENVLRMIVIRNILKGNLIWCWCVGWMIWVYKILITKITKGILIEIKRAPQADFYQQGMNYILHWHFLPNQDTL